MAVGYSFAPSESLSENFLWKSLALASMLFARFRTKKRIFGSIRDLDCAQWRKGRQPKVLQIARAQKESGPLRCNFVEREHLGARLLSYGALHLVVDHTAQH
jgi:hypothetical protein